MRIISKITVVAAFAAFFTQNAFSQISFGIKAGGNFANMNLSDDDEGTAKGIITFQAGAILEAPITSDIGIRTGLELQGKGFKIDESDAGVTIKSTINPMYVQVPIVIAYTGPAFYIGAGPYFGLGVAGKSKTKISGLGAGFDIDEEDDIEFGSGADDTFSPLDLGARFEAGIKLNSIRIGLNYDLGLANAIAKDARDGESAKHGVLGLSVGYMF